MYITSLDYDNVPVLSITNKEYDIWPPWYCIIQRNITQHYYVIYHYMSWNLIAVSYLRSILIPHVSWLGMNELYENKGFTGALLSAITIDTMSSTTYTVKLLCRAGFQMCF